MFDRSQYQHHSKMDSSALYAYISQHMPGLVPQLQALVQRRPGIGGGLLGGFGGGTSAPSPFQPYERPTGGGTLPPGVTPYPQGATTPPRPGSGPGTTLTPRFQPYERPTSGGSPAAGPYQPKTGGTDALTELLRRRQG